MNGEQIRSEEIKTKRGELVVATKQIELELNDLLKYSDAINLRLKLRKS